MTDFDSAGSVVGFVTGPALTAFLNGFFALLFMGILFFHHTILASIIIIGGTSLATIRCIIAQFERPLRKKSIEMNAEERNNFLDVLSSIEQIKLFNVEATRLTEWKHHLTNGLNSGYKLGKFLITVNGFYGLANSLLSLSISGTAIYYVINSEITIGTMFLILTYRSMLLSNLGGVVNAITALINISVHIDRFEYICGDKKTAPNIQTHKDKESIGVRCKNLAFSYDTYQKENILKDINLEIQPGSRVLLIGDSGSGKTTLLKILMGLVPDFTGEVDIGNMRLNENTSDLARKFTSGVMQGQTVSGGTIIENIRFFDDTITDDKIQSAIDVCELSDVIKSLPMQGDTVIGPNFGPLSSGQKQRLLLARAAAKKSPLTFFDEGTSNLDKETEKRVINNWLNYYRGTLICTSHNTAAYKDFDRILAVEQGCIKTIK